MTEIFKIVIYGLVEGITEWLPISSTGHLILLREILPLSVAPALGEQFSDEYFDMFEVVVQLGAILAVIVTYFNRLFPFLKKNRNKGNTVVSLWIKILVASIPAAFVGIVLDKLIEILSGRDIDGWIYNPQTVVTALIVYGALFILIELISKGKPHAPCSAEDISFTQAVLIGGFQALSIVPGTSRSGSTILGARLLGIAPKDAAEFSFFMSIPAMTGGSLIKALSFLSFVKESNIAVPLSAWISLFVASTVAFAVSMTTIGLLTDFVKRHSFIPFGIYRIVLGVVVSIYFFMR